MVVKGPSVFLVVYLTFIDVSTATCMRLKNGKAGVTYAFRHYQILSAGILAALPVANLASSLSGFASCTV